MNTLEFLNKFVTQATTSNLKTASYPKEWNGFKVKVSFGMGVAARVPWIAFTAPELAVSNGYYPVYLYYKDLGVLILSYGISETHEFEETWPFDITRSAETIKAYLGDKIPRYGSSYVFKAYSVTPSGGLIDIIEKHELSARQLDSDLEEILRQYQAATNSEVYDTSSTINQGIFYLEKQLEDFIIQNWNNTDLGEKYELIVEEGELVSQQYRTDVGPIDILAQDKRTKSYVVIELKKNQTSDDTIGQVARYMGWVQDKLGDTNVRGIIIAHSYDKKLDYALRLINRVEVYVYEVDFRLKEFRRDK